MTANFRRYVQRQSEPPSPATIANVRAFFRSDMGVSLNGSNVSAWANQTVTTITPLTQATASKQPLYQASGSAGRPSILCDGSTDQLNGGPLSEWITTTTGVIYALCRPIAATITNARADLNHCIVGNAGGAAGIFQRATPDVMPWNYDGTNDSGTAVPNVLGAVQVIRFRHEGGNIYARVGAVEGVAVASGATTSLGGLIAVGGADVYSPCLNVELLSLVAMQVVPTSGENVTIVRWLNWFGGLPA